MHWKSEEEIWKSDQKNTKRMARFCLSVIDRLIPGVQKKFPLNKNTINTIKMRKLKEHSLLRLAITVIGSRSTEMRNKELHVPQISTLKNSMTATQEKNEKSTFKNNDCKVPHSTIADLHVVVI